MTWTRILTPLLGGDNDGKLLRAATALAAPFDAHVTGAFIAATPTSLLTWISGESLNALEMAVGSIQQAALDGERNARARFGAITYPCKDFTVSDSEGWAGLRMSARFSDVVVFDAAAARGEGFLAEAFQQILMDERRPVFVTSRVVDLDGPVALAWDGGREASRAARRAVPWLQKAKEVMIFTAPNATPRAFAPGNLTDYLADQGINARLISVSGAGETGPLLMEAAHRLGVKLMVAGAFGHPRFQRFIFGGTTQTLLDQMSGPALFLSH